MTEKGCDNCYYTYFDERAYPCSLCIRGIERTDQWQPSKKKKGRSTGKRRGRVMFEEWSATLTLTKESSEELFRVLKEQDEAFINDVLDGKCGFTLESADGRRVELVPKADRKTEPTISKMEQVETMSCEECKHWIFTSQWGWFCPLKGQDECHYEPIEDEPQTDYERASEQREHDILYEPTYNPEDGSM